MIVHKINYYLANIFNATPALLVKTIRTYGWNPFTEYPCVVLELLYVLDVVIGYHPPLITVDPSIPTVPL